MDKVKSTFIKTAVALGVTAASLASVPAQAAPTWFQPFQVDEGAIPGTGAPVIANTDIRQIDGTYLSTINQSANTGGGNLTAGQNTFVETGFISLSGFKDGASSVNGYFGSIPPAGYNMYAVFSFSGTSQVQGADIHAIFNSASVSLYADPDQNTVQSTTAPAVADGTTPGTVAPLFPAGTASEDILLGTATTGIFGDAKLTGGSAFTAGSFDFFLTNWTLTPTGKTYFASPASPVPGFYNAIRLNGNIDQVTTGLLTPPGSFNDTAAGTGTLGLTGAFVANSTGHVALSFDNVTVPEPGSLLLFGAGLAALGAKRKKKESV